MDIDEVSTVIAKWLIPKEKNSKENLEIASYGICALITSFLNIFLATIVFIIFRRINDYIVFLCFFIPIRSNHKGYHCKTLSRCILLTNILFTSSIFVSVHLKNYTSIFLNIIFFLLVITHYYISYEKKMIFHILLIFIYIFINCLHIESYLIVALFLNLLLIGGKKINEKYFI